MKTQNATVVNKTVKNMDKVAKTVNEEQKAIWAQLKYEGWYKEHLKVNGPPRRRFWKRNRFQKRRFSRY